MAVKKTGIAYVLVSAVIAAHLALAVAWAIDREAPARAAVLIANDLGVR